MLRRTLLFMFITLSLILDVTGYANDSAVETAAGGLKLRKERNVLMQKERLYISKDQITVEYEFLNTTNGPVVSEVAFPIPAYRYKYDDPPRNFADFKAWIDGQPIDVKKEVRAFVQKREVTADLRNAGLNIETFGDFDPDDETKRALILEPDIRKKLIKVGAIKNRDKSEPQRYGPEWECRIKYHWTQEFPANSVVRIKHVYKPVVGYSPVQIQKFKQQFTDTCVTNATYSEARKRVEEKMRINPGNNNYFGVMWVSYILTTANTWQTPIKDFELIVEGETGDLPSFCWDGPIESLSENKLKAHKIDYVPSKDLKIYFLTSF